MPKQIVNEDQFIELCNEELRKHPDYKEGMKIIGSPEGASGSSLSGYQWIGPESMKGLVSIVVNRVKEHYEVSCTPR